MMDLQLVTLTPKAISLIGVGGIRSHVWILAW
jgi:hypothetical protein